MALPATRAEFKEYCLRKLGKPVIEINVDPDQVEDRIDESLQYWYDYHFDGSEKEYYKHQITQNDIDNGYITIPENIIGVINVFNIGTSTNNMFSPRYQYLLNGMYEIANYNLIDYFLHTQHLRLIEDLLVGVPPIRYNRHTNKLFIDTNWEKFKVDHYLVIEAYKIVDPTTYSDVWKDRWLQNYTTAKIKYQWGSNLTKFQNMQLPGGVIFNGDQIIQDAREEIRLLEEDMINSYSLPVYDMIG